MLVAGVTALVSGVSVFVNSYGVHSFSSPALYTTAKNMAAVLFLALVADVYKRQVPPMRLRYVKQSTPSRSAFGKIRIQAATE